MSDPAEPAGSACPEAKPGLDVNEVPDGLVIYDTERDRVHYLNPTAALIFVLCTGDNDEATIAEQVGLAYALDRAPAEETATALANLRAEGLLV
jgi:Coenzyme PQQ synthesis protein D (PqqD)